GHRPPDAPCVTRAEPGDRRVGAATEADVLEATSRFDVWNAWSTRTTWRFAAPTRRARRRRRTGLNGCSHEPRRSHRANVHGPDVAWTRAQGAPPRRHARDCRRATDPVRALDLGARSPYDRV